MIKDYLVCKTIKLKILSSNVSYKTYFVKFCESLVSDVF